MIVYFVGIPGSGKTYSAVNTIYNNFSDDKDAKKDIKKDYINCYTNINEFKFDVINNVFRLDFDYLYSSLLKLHTMYKNKKTDDELIETAKELNIYKTLFVIDECHNFFDTAKPVLVWWLTYHRHLYHDIILITQNLSLVNAKFKPLAEAFYRAKPNSLLLNKKYFRYTYFTDSRLTQSSKVNVIKLKKNNKVFDLYKSGDVVKSKNIILYFLFISFFLFIVLIIFLLLFSNDKQTEIEKSKSQDNKKELTNYHHTSFVSENKNDDYSSKVLIVLNCSYAVCSNSDISLPPQLLRKFIDMELLHSYYVEKINNSLSNFYLSSDKDFYNFLKSTKRHNYENSDIIEPINIFSDGK